jgi:hypothetical protein
VSIYFRSPRQRLKHARVNLKERALRQGILRVAGYRWFRHGSVPSPRGVPMTI